MIPSPQELATLAPRRRDELTRRLKEAAAETGSSLLPAVLRRCIATTVVCHQVLGGLDRVVSSTNRELGRRPTAVEPEWKPSSDSGFARVFQTHLSLAVNRALISYGEILRAMDWRIQRQSMDQFLEFLFSIEVVGGGTDRPQTLEPLTKGAFRIKALLEARRPQTAITGILFRDHESFNVEATAWCYCAALLTEIIRNRAAGSAGVKIAVRTVDALRSGLEKALAPPPPPVKRPALRVPLPARPRERGAGAGTPAVPAPRAAAPEASRSEGG